MSEVGSVLDSLDVHATGVAGCRAGWLSRRYTVRGTLLATCFGVFGACGAPVDRVDDAPDAASTSAGIAEAGSIRQSFHMQVPVAPSPVATAGTRRLVYELHLINFAGEASTIERLDVVDADNGTLLTTVGAEALALRLGGPATSSTQGQSSVLAPGMLGIVYLEIDVPEVVPRFLDHRLIYRSGGDGPGATATVRGGRTPVGSERAVVLSPPVRGGPWVAVYHPSWQRGHRRVAYAIGGSARIPGRYAVDWFRVDSAGLRASTPEDEVANWHGYGEDVLAVADGVVAAVRTDVPESATLSAYVPPSLADATGNYVALDIGAGRYAFYEHLQPGSIRVRQGERVERGQLIASVGFTGSSSGPHLHFHVADANSPLAAEGVPFVLDRFEVVGSYAESDLFAEAGWRPPTGAGGSRTEELPAPNTVIVVEDRVR